MMYVFCSMTETDELLAERTPKGERVFKQGIANGNPKGSPAWRDKAQAMSWLADQFGAHPDSIFFQGLALYEVEGEWCRDTIQYEGEPHARLIVTRPLRKKVEE